MEQKMVDVTVHIDENLNDDQRGNLEESVRQQAGVIGVGYHENKPHLMVIEYNPDEVSSADLANLIKNQGVHAELIGL